MKTRRIMEAELCKELVKPGSKFYEDDLRDLKKHLARKTDGEIKEMFVRWCLPHIEIKMELDKMAKAGMFDKDWSEK